MYRFAAPAPPNDFEQKAERRRREVVKARREGRKIPWESKFWSGYKEHFSAAQHAKCALCEERVMVVAYGDVEHYRPKDAVWELQEEGQERPNLSSVKGRKRTLLSSDGYWWLGYAWENWFLACAICNQAWKGAYFPVADESSRTLPPDPDAREKPLLLHPYIGPDPSRHLKFTRAGGVEPRPRSKHGRESIRIYGLNRPQLVRARAAKAEDVFRCLDRMAAADEQRQDEYLEDIHRWGGIDRPHCGMVRSIFEEHIDMTWQDLDEYVRDLEARRSGS